MAKRQHRPAYLELSDYEFELLKKDSIIDPWRFIDLIDYHGGTGNFDTVHRELLEFLTSTWERRLVLMPRGHLKSTLCSTLYVLWRIYQNPNIRILVACSVRELATGFVREVKQYLEDVDLQEKVWNNRPHFKGRLIPDIDRMDGKRRRGTSSKVEDADWVLPEEFGGSDRKVLWRANAIQVVRPEIFKEPTLYACSAGMQATGWHFDLIILDDIVTFENSDTPAKADKLKTWALDMESIVNRRSGHLGDEFVVLGTRYYNWDYYGHLMGTDLTDEAEVEEYIDTQNTDPLYLFKKDIYGGGYVGKYRYNVPEEEKTSRTGYLCPKLMNATTEKKLRRRLGARRFASQYLNMVIHDDEVFFDYERINWYSILKLTKKEKYYRLDKGQDNPPWFIAPVMCVDPAASLSSNANYSCVGVGGRVSTGELVILDIAFGRWTPSELADKIQALMEKWVMKSVIIESGGTQVAIIHSIKERWSQNGFTGYIRDELPKGDKKQKILDALEPVFEGSLLWMPSYLANVKEIKDEIMFFPASGQRDDVLDVLEKIARYAPKISVDLAEKRLRRKSLKAKGKVNLLYGGIR